MESPFKLYWIAFATTLALLLAACGNVAPAPTETPSASATPEPTRTVHATATSAPTKPAVPTRTLTPTLNTTLATQLEAREALTSKELTEPRPPGVYEVGGEIPMWSIAPGTWRSTGSSSFCDWSITGEGYVVLDSYSGPAGGSIYIGPSAVSVKLGPDCGIWEYLGPP